MAGEAYARSRGWVESALDLNADLLASHWAITTRPAVADGEPGSRAYWPPAEPYAVHWPHTAPPATVVPQRDGNASLRRRTQTTPTDDAAATAAALNTWFDLNVEVPEK